jgi:septal ring factor EnvC (AmiA/AmiB activator)
MSEERFERIEAQIAELRELILQQNMATKQDFAVMQQNMNAMREDIAVLHQRSDSTQQNMNAMREDIAVLRQRSDSLEGTVIVAMREGFDSLRNYIDDLNYDLANNERKQRRLGRRVARLERKDEED